MFGLSPYLTTEGEEKIVEWLKYCESIGLCVELSMVRAVVHKVASELGIEGFTSERDWMTRFMEHHPDVAQRIGELTSRKRLRFIYPDRMAHYCNSLKPLVVGWSHVLQEGGHVPGPSSLTACTRRPCTTRPQWSPSGPRRSMLAIVTKNLAIQEAGETKRRLNEAAT